jgi:predicted transcriptional regulator
VQGRRGTLRCITFRCTKLLFVASHPQQTMQERRQERDMFPAVGSSWAAFHDIKTLLKKTGKQSVSEVMTKNPICVSRDTCMDEAARLLLLKKIHRLPVVNENGELVGVLSRGNVVKAVLRLHQEAKLSSGSGSRSNGSDGTGKATAALS